MKMRVVGFDDFLTRCQICVLSTGDVTVLIPELEKDEQLWDPLHVFKSMGECKRFIVELAVSFRSNFPHISLYQESNFRSRFIE